jgi:hypothetical protein
VAYSGYKYVGLVINSVVGLLGGAQAYYVVRGGAGDGRFG